MAIVNNYTSFGGVHPESAAIRNVLAAHGVQSAHTHQPLSEAMVLGISGGLGAGYILWGFQGHQINVLIVAFHNRWQYPMEFYHRLADRLGIKIGMPETGSRKTAAQTLDGALNSNFPAVAWVDRASMPYFQLPESMRGHLGHIVSICGSENGGYLVDDLAAQPFRVDAESMAEARGRIGSYKNRLVLIGDAPATVELEGAIQMGLEDCITHLSSSSESFSLPAIHKWAKTMTESKNKKGWLKVFADRRGLFSTLISLFESIELDGAPGGLRNLYADFLSEAEGIIGNSRLSEPAEHYRKLAGEWTLLAEEALPNTIPLFKETKTLLRQRDVALKQGGEAWRETAELSEQIRAKRTEGNLALPLDDTGVMELFTTLRDRLNIIYQAELAALESLKSAVL